MILASNNATLKYPAFIMCESQRELDYYVHPTKTTCWCVCMDACVSVMMCIVTLTIISTECMEWTIFIDLQASDAEDEISALAGHS